MELRKVEEFYRAEAKAQNWQVDTNAKVEKKSGDKTTRGVVLSFRSSAGPITVILKPKGQETSIHITSRNEAKSKKDGILPEAGKARLVMANAHTQDVVITIGKTDYKLKAGRGAKDLKTALNHSIVPGKYSLTIKIPGERPQT